jgi:prolyl oligopeptidase
MNLETDTPESLAWQEDRNAKAAAYVVALPGRDALAASIAAKLSDTRLAPVVGRGGKWFQKVVLEPSAEEPVLVVRNSPTGEPRVLLDPNELTAKRGAPVTLMVFAPSPDGRTVAAVVSEAGRELNELVLIDVETGERLPDEIPHNVSNFAWLADSSGLVFGTREVIDGVQEWPLYRHVLGTTVGEPLASPRGIGDLRPIVSSDGRHVLVATGNTEQRLDWIVAGDALVPVLPDVEGGISGAVHDGQLYAVLDGGSPRGRLVRIPIATATDRSSWTELVAESDDVLRFVAVVTDVIVLGYLRDAVSGLRLLDLEGQVLEEIDVPGEGVISAYAYGASHPALPMLVQGDDEISFIRSTFDTAWAVYRYVVSERRLELVTPPAVTIPGIAVSTVTPVSNDGAALPTQVVRRADLDTSVPQPTLIYGYGGFNLSQIPAFSAEFAAWVEAGGVLVFAHLRGGSDFGAEWWQQGRRERKQQTFDDLYAIAEHLIETGVTTREQLAVKGESNGGLLTAAAIVQRPDLWAGVACDVPITDLIGFARDPLTYYIGRDEYGDPNLPEEAEWLRRISPVHNVQPASYPPLLVTAGANDPRCPVWQSRVFVDLLEKAQQGDAPILLRVYADQGHGASGLHGASEKNADWLAFVAHATGLQL